jgi:hypothetical protein
MAHAYNTRRGKLRKVRLKSRQFAITFNSIDFPIYQSRDAGTVIAAIFQALQAFKNHLHARSSTNKPNHTTH